MSFGCRPQAVNSRGLASRALAQDAADTHLGRRAARALAQNWGSRKPTGRSLLACYILCILLMIRSQVAGRIPTRAGPALTPAAPHLRLPGAIRGEGAKNLAEAVLLWTETVGKILYTLWEVLFPRRKAHLSLRAQP